MDHDSIDSGSETEVDSTISTNASTTISDYERNALRRKLFELDQIIPSLEHKRDTLKKVTLDNRNRLICAMDRLTNKEIIDRKYLDCIETPFKVLGNHFEDIEAMLLLGGNLLDQVQRDNQAKRVREHLLDPNNVHSSRSKFSTAALEDMMSNQRLPNEKEIIDEIMNSMSDEEKTKVLYLLIAEHQEEKKTNAKIINEFIMYYKVEQQRLLAQNSTFPESSEESDSMKIEKTECITIADTQVI